MAGVLIPSKQLRTGGSQNEYRWHFVGDGECEQYLQIEQDKFCFKIWVFDSKKRIILRNYWQKKIVNECSKHGINAKRPDRFGNGEYMTVAILDQEFGIVDDCGMLDMQQTIKIIRSAEFVLDAMSGTNQIDSPDTAKPAGLLFG